MKTDVIYTKDCLEGIAKRLPDESIDLIATDPPYAIAFMGKKWDTFHRMEDFFIPRWQECLRVLKAGGFAFVMCSPRADVMATQILCLQEAGFMVGFTPIFWAYASGFPKAQNIGKAVDKRMGAEREVVGQKTCGYQVSISKKRQEEGYRPNLTRATKEVDITLPATSQAQILDGSYAGFQPKPAVEVVIVAMKPLSEKSYVDQALKNRKGITWLDEGKIPYESDRDKESARFGTQMDIRNNNYKTPKGVYGKNVLSSPRGRFPANLLVSGDVLNDGRTDKGTKPHKVYSHVDKYQGWGTITKKQGEIVNFGDSGSFSRYFSLDSWFDKKLKELPKNVQKTFPFLIVPKASKAEKNRGLEKKERKYMDPSRKPGSPGGTNPRNRGAEKKRANYHPTVKPIKLMSYLILLGSREGDVILDPFIGSGTTAIAAKMLGRRYIGFEINEEYAKIAKARLSILEPLLI